SLSSGKVSCGRAMRIDEVRESDPADNAIRHLRRATGEAATTPVRACGEVRCRNCTTAQPDPLELAALQSVGSQISAIHRNVDAADVIRGRGSEIEARAD